MQQMASLLASLDSLEKVEIIVAFVIIINIIVIVISIMVMIVNIIVIVISIDVIICQYPDSREKVTSKKSRREGRKHSKREKEAKKNSEDSVMRLVDVIKLISKFSSQLHCQGGLRDLL